jgi:hypothetical protein
MVQTQNTNNTNWLGTVLGFIGGAANTAKETAIAADASRKTDTLIKNITILVGLAIVVSIFKSKKRR